MHVLDTNVVIRYIVWDGWELFQESLLIFEKIKDSRLQVEIPVYIVMEIVFVLEKFYNIPLDVVIEHVEKILLLPGVVNIDKEEIISALYLHQQEKIDLADALLVWYARFSQVQIISFDKKINSLLNS